MGDTRCEISVAYVISMFPGLSKTFINREIRGLRTLGGRVKCYSIHRPPEAEISDKVRDLVGETFYVFPVKPFSFISSHIAFFCRHPLRYLGTLLFLITRKGTRLSDRLKTAFHFCEGIHMARQIERDGIRHVHAHFAFSPATCAMVIARMLDIGFSFTAHALDYPETQVLRKEKVEAAKFIVSVSEYNRRLMDESVPGSAEKTSIVRCGVDPSEFEPNHVPSDVFTILSIGRLVPQKCQTYLVEACKALKERGVEFECLIIGDGPDERKLKAMIREYGLEDVVKLRGPAFQEEIRRYYDMADVFVLPSLIEGIPVVYMEAMSKEAPVIATRIAGVPELIENGVSGILVEPRQVGPLADAIFSLVNDSELRKEIGKNARQRVLDEFDIWKSVRKLKAVFESQLC
ncbi:glycosyltransferase family 4 protein [Candidatus Hydrogenedentota bacterium]